MKRLLLACAILGLAWPIWAMEPCKVRIHRHERHTTTAQKRQAYQNAGIKWEDRRSGKCAGGCVVDHIVSLEIGGRDEVANMQIQTKAEGKLKDIRENFLARCVCDGKTTLKKAQSSILRWKEIGLSRCP